MNTTTIDTDAEKLAELAEFIRTYAATYGTDADADAAELLAEARDHLAAGRDADAFNVWVSTYGAYNAGALYGYWADAHHAPETVPAFAAAMIVRGSHPLRRLHMIGEELHCFDVENMPGRSHEIDPAEARAIAEKLDELADLSDDERAAFEAYANDQNAGSIVDADRDEFADAYYGTWESLEDWAAEWLEDTGTLDSIPENLRGYFDTAAWARDARLSGDVYALEVAGGVAVFHS